MSNFALRRESIEETVDYNVAISQFENDVEQRRLKHANKIIGFKITTPIMDYTTLQTYRNFVINKYGALTSFTFTSPFDNVEYSVRLEPGSFQTTYRAAVFQSTFNLKVVH